MSKFFDSEIIQQELQEIDDLQKEIYANIFTFGSASREDKLKHVEKLSTLIEKERIMHTRLSLSDDPQAMELKKHLKQSLSLIGISPDMDMNLLFQNLSKSIEELKDHLSN